jgi:hypothetical protein
MKQSCSMIAREFTNGSDSEDREDADHVAPNHKHMHNNAVIGVDSPVQHSTALNRHSRLSIGRCIALLDERRATHPSLCDMWTTHLLSKKPSESDIKCCLEAIDKMDSIPDISQTQAVILHDIFSTLFNRGDDSSSSRN